jgi:peptidylprolyl isomerase
MKPTISIFVVALALFYSGCGRNDAAAPTGEEKSPALDEPRFPSGTTEPDPHFATITTTGKAPRAKLKIVPPDLPPPKRLMVKDLELGTGPVAKRGDDVAVWYHSVKYKTGKSVYFNWPPASPFVIELGSGGGGVGFEEGVEGMRVGGRREVLIPARMMYGGGAMDYVVELARIEPGSKAPGNS